MVNRAGITKRGCLVFVVVFAAVLYFGIPAGQTYFRYLQYKDSIKQELRFRSGLPNERIKKNLQLIADSLGLPPEAADVTITRKDGQITVDAVYEEIFRLPGYQKPIVYKPHVTDTY